MKTLRRWMASLGMTTLALSILPTLAQAAVLVPMTAADSDAQVVTENGTIGILYVQGVYEVVDRFGRSTLILVTEDPSFTELSKLTRTSASPVTLTMARPELRVLLRRHSTDAGILRGRVSATGQAVFVMSKQAAQKLF